MGERDQKIGETAAMSCIQLDAGAGREAAGDSRSCMCAMQRSASGGDTLPTSRRHPRRHQRFGFGCAVQWCTSCRAATAATRPRPGAHGRRDPRLAMTRHPARQAEAPQVACTAAGGPTSRSSLPHGGAGKEIGCRAAARKPTLLRFPAPSPVNDMIRKAATKASRRISHRAMVGGGGWERV